MVRISGFALSSGLRAVNKFLEEIQQKGGQIINTQVVAVEYSQWLYITYETGTGQSVDHAKIQELVLQLEKEQIEMETINIDLETTDTLFKLTKLVCEEYSKLFTEEDKKELAEYRRLCEDKAKNLEIFKC